MTSFSQLASDVQKMRMNYGAPDSMKSFEPVKTTDMINKTITINQIVVMNKPKKKEEVDENGKTVYVNVKSKDGTKDIYQPIVYVAFDDNKYFVTKSQFLIEQLEAATKQQLVYYEKKDVVVNGLEGVSVKISQEKVKYRDGKYYDQVVFKDAE